MDAIHSIDVRYRDDDDPDLSYLDPDSDDLFYAAESARRLADLRDGTWSPVCLHAVATLISTDGDYYTASDLTTVESAWICGIESDDADTLAQVRSDALADVRDLLEAEGYTSAEIDPHLPAQGT